MLLDNDYIADKQPDGRYVIYTWNAGQLRATPGHEGSYDEAEVYRRLEELRPDGDTYVRENGDVIRYIQP